MDFRTPEQKRNNFRVKQYAKKTENEPKEGELIKKKDFEKMELKGKEADQLRANAERRAGEIEAKLNQVSSQYQGLRQELSTERANMRREMEEMRRENRMLEKTIHAINQGNMEIWRHIQADDKEEIRLMRELLREL